MRNLVFAALAATAVLATTDLSSAADEKWVTIKGQVVFPADKKIPERAKLNVTQDKDHCLSKGDILDETMIVNTKNKGIKNVVVYLRPDDTAVAEFPKDSIFPDDAKRKPAEVVIDQPCCMFVNRVTLARVGDTILVKNSAPVPHNFFWDTEKNGSHNITVPKMDSWKMPAALVKDTAPIQYKCTIHGWMTGYVRIFDHPYAAVTDENGNFEIKNAPAGKVRIVFWHENGLRNGVKGRFGEQIEAKGPTTELKPTEFDITPRS
jgi:hypothetical protein